MIVNLFSFQPIFLCLLLYMDKLDWINIGKVECMTAFDFGRISKMLWIKWKLQHHDDRVHLCM